MYVVKSLKDFVFKISDSQLLITEYYLVSLRICIYECTYILIVMLLDVIIVTKCLPKKIQMTDLFHSRCVH